ncbi:MAG: ABC transporter permease [Blastocatellia bacterium]
MQTFLQDLRYGFRLLGRKPGFTTVAIFALALGIGANTAIFSVVNSILLRPLPYPDPERLVQLNHNYPQISLKASVSAFGFTKYRELAQSFDYLTAVTGGSRNLTSNGEPEQVQSMSVTASLFPLLGATAAKGRVLLPEEEQQGKHRVAVLSDGLWKRRFGADPNLVNQTITLDGESYTVAGVMPPGFQFGREFGRVVDLWTPLSFTPDQLDSRRMTNEFLSVFGRLKQGISFQQAQSEMDALADNMRKTYAPQMTPAMWGLLLQSVNELIVGDIRPALWMLLGAVGLVLLIACANVANLLLARAADRQREIAVRAALGAGRMRVSRQLLTESVLLGLVGGLLGLGIALTGIKLLTNISAIRIPRMHEIGIDWRVLLFTLGVSLLTGILFGLFPALQMSRGNLHDTLKEGGRTGQSGARGWLRGALVVIEMALALMLLVGAGLLMRSFWRLQQVSPGFQPQGVLSMMIALPANKYPDAAARMNFFRQLMPQLRALPGVESAGACLVVPMSGNNSSGSFSIEGRQIPDGQSMPHGDRWQTVAGYFETMKIPLRRGRYFTDSDTAAAQPVIVIDETMARKYWPNEDPLGKRISFDRDAAGQPVWREIVGLVGHVRHQGLEGESRVQYYVPFTQRATTPGMYLVARTAGDPAGLTAAVRGAIRNLDREMPVFRVSTMETLVADSLAQRRFTLWLLGIFACAALALAAVGLYGVLAYSVTQRSHEIGLRMALGAQRRDVLRMIVRQGMTLALAGIAIGLALAFGLMRLLTKLLFEVGAGDPLTYVAIALVLGVVALLACLIPALRATRVDPMVALRYE